MSAQAYGFPQKAAPVEQLLEIIAQKKQKDIDWHRGRAFCLIYYPGKEREEAIKKVFDSYYADSALNPTAMPSLAELEAETVSMCADLFGGDAQVCGNITSGGTESIILAVKTARDWAKKNKPHIARAHVVIPESAHPAFMKAFQFLDVDYTAVKTGKDLRADVAAMENAIASNTILLVASAPSYPYGVVDPVAEVAALAKRKNLLCHVDACVGGFMLPFLREAGYKAPAFDFSVEGVTSLSADIHKYGYSPKGASVILYKNHDLRRQQFSLYTKWSGGIYASPTVTGTRPGANIAGAWAALHVIGKEGYIEMARATMETTLKIKGATMQVPELEIIGEPDMSIVAFKSDKLDVYMIADELNKKGWHFERQQLPPSLHFTVNYIHRQVVDEFLHDLLQAVETVRQSKMEQLGNKLQTSVVKGLSKLLPEGMIAKLQKNQTGGLDNEKKAAMYGMMGALSGTDDLDQIVLDFLDDIYTAKP
ncbi:MAG TPA: aspartate aminotransferase family protein [Chitinophagales bacterium]|nr:aspartate aminotransferase family protein [Chitinophagales bacterium]